ncbi:MAG TPA: hypothetical protein VGW33_00945 [Terriglobia bacterium]|nr:hypothetical protein [Terriglobia bacterium]
MPAYRPLTPAQFRAQRRNARRSTGPRTIEGRRRSTLNYRQLRLPREAIELLQRVKGDPRDFLRLWRDVLAVFWFMGREMEPYLSVLAWDWWLKQHLARRGEPEHALRAIDARLEEALVELVAAYRWINREWRYRFMQEIGSTGELDIGHLRLAVETRLRAYQDLAEEGKLPQLSPMELAVSQMAEMMAELGVEA